MPDYLVKGGVTYRILTDYQGSPRLVVDTATGLVAQRLDYDEFGNVLVDTNPGFQPFGFAGGLYDRDTKFTRFGARDYDPTVDRWSQKAPLLFGSGDTNLYGYSLSDPVNVSDPDGLEADQTGATGAALIIGGLGAVVAGVGHAAAAMTIYGEVTSSSFLVGLGAVEATLEFTHTLVALNATFFVAVGFSFGGGYAIGTAIVYVFPRSTNVGPWVYDTFFDSDPFASMSYRPIRMQFRPDPRLPDREGTRAVCP